MYVLPVLLLHCRQALLLDAEPGRPDSVVSYPDSYQHLPLACSPPAAPQLQKQNSGSMVDEFLSSLIASLKTAHFSSYLKTVCTALREDDLILPQDFQSAVRVCLKTSLSIPFTPLIAGLCEHAMTGTEKEEEGGKEEEEEEAGEKEKERGEKEGDGGEKKKQASLTAEQLCGLLSDVLSHKLPRQALSLSCREPSSSWCERWRNDFGQACASFLGKVGFKPVPGSTGYYWMHGKCSGECPPPVLEMTVVEDTEEEEEKVRLFTSCC